MRHLRIADALNTTKDDKTMPAHPRILIIDDRPLIIDILSESLERQGLPVAIATSEQDALSQLSANIFDVILTTLTLPGCNAGDLIDGIRRRNPCSPIILLGADDVFIQKVAQIEGIYILNKTMGISEILDFLKETLA